MTCVSFEPLLVAFMHVNAGHRIRENFKNAFLVLALWPILGSLSGRKIPCFSRYLFIFSVLRCRWGSDVFHVRRVFLVSSILLHRMSLSVYFFFPTVPFSAAFHSRLTVRTSNNDKIKVDSHPSWAKNSHLLSAFWCHVCRKAFWRAHDTWICCRYLSLALTTDWIICFLQVVPTARQFLQGSMTAWPVDSISAILSSGYKPAVYPLLLASKTSIDANGRP